MTTESNASCRAGTAGNVRKQARRDAAEFGRRVRGCRAALRISQEQLGERSGLHRTYIGHLERGEVNPTLHNVLLVAQALGVDAADLVRGLRTDGAEPAAGTGGEPGEP
ncbi:MAG: helix-turn-helix domain-containing protein [Actinobacteria bacterium]|nr:helix-turn-helix domain-containing protein [Actinomycetota bacterium]